MLSRQRGATLLEALVALFLVAFGLMAMAGMQIRALNETRNSGARNMASQMASDLLDRMLLNLAAFDTGGSVDLYRTDWGVPAPAAVNCQTQTCNPAELAQFDLWQWKSALAGWNSGNVCQGATDDCQPLMVARTASNKAQPILVAPTWLVHPLGGVVLNFGTGRLLEEKDRKDKTTQTLYGVWDSSRYARTLQGVTALHGPNVPASATRTSLVEQSFTGMVVQASDTVDLRSFVNSTRNTVAYSTTESTAPRGWYVDLPALGERLLVHPQLQDGLLVRFETQIPPSSPEEGLCSASIRSEQGYVMVLNGVSGSAAQKAVFYSSDSTLDLSSASRVAFGSGDLVRIESGDKQMLLNTQAGGVGKSDNDPLAYRWKLQLVRQKSSPVAVDWRLLP